MSLSYHVVDAFARQPFEGNPAAVYQLDSYPGDDLLQRIALEMNLSETAFVVSRPSGEYDLRWFTPGDEVDLCGHATLAAAHVLFEADDGLVDIDFHTRSGVLTVRRARTGRYVMDFPAEPVAPVDPPPGIHEALGSEIIAMGRNRMDYLAEMENERTVRSLRPDLDFVAALDARGLIVTARADAGGDVDFVSRFFAPQLGVPEDPVTGSAHCALSPWWSGKLGRPDLAGWQASPRGGRVEVVHRGDRVDLVGSAVTVAQGRLHV